MPEFLQQFDWTFFAQQCIGGLTIGTLFALIALGYTMVYGIVELINFAHGDLFMLGSMLVLYAFLWLGFDSRYVLITTPVWLLAGSLFLAFIAAPLLCGPLNFGVDMAVYKPLRTAPKLAPLVSAIGVSFVFMNVGLFFGGAQDVNVPDPFTVAVDAATGGETQKQSAAALVGGSAYPTHSPTVPNLLAETNTGLRFTPKDAMVVCVTVPLMAALSLFVGYSRLGKAMRATAQNPVAARLMGIDTDRVVGATFLIGGGLAGFGSVMYALYLNTVSYQMGFQNGLYAFTAAVLGGIGNITGAVLGGLVIGLVRTLGSAYVGETWTSALVFAVLIVILVFRPSGLLGSRTPEKV